MKLHLHLAMPIETRQLLKRLQKRIGVSSMTEVIRYAVVLFDVVSTEQEKGSRLFIHDKIGEQTRIHFL